MMKKRFPFSANPVGWYVVAYSDELAKGAVLPISYFGTELVLFRTEDGSPHVLDAHCPHLGAHLGHGGVVEGNVLRCPFHAWCFSGDGDCTSIPHAKKLPVAARLQAWPVCERNGFVLVHYHPEHEAPTSEVPIMPEHGSPEWTPYARRRWIIRTNIHDMVENAFDAMHFQHLHGLRNLPSPEVSFEGASCRMFTDTVMDTPAGQVKGALDIRKVGLGFGTARFTGVIETLVFTTLTPIDDERVDARFSFTVKKLPDAQATEAVGNRFIDELSRQVEQDIRIWEHKLYLERPLLTEGDGGITRFRRWARQFYPVPG
ncbi:Vanillate O-demethylase oxygenase subunit protein [Minicystis rosea]|nr:Vanillate O-demethylase oxygenase subunit protein [Minicystis rosea]